jgi:hypothetical protein
MVKLLLLTSIMMMIIFHLKEQELLMKGNFIKLHLHGNKATEIRNNSQI